LTFGVGIAWTILLFLAFLPVPFLSDSWIHLERAGGFPGAGSAFDLHQAIYRPFEILWYYVLHVAGWESAVIGRIPGFLEHAAVIFLVYGISRRMGMGTGAAAIAALLFALAPNTKSIGSVTVQNTPARGMFVLAGLSLFAMRKRHPVLGTVGPALCLVQGLLFHPSSLELVPLCAVWILLIEGPDEPGWDVRKRLRACRSDLLSPALLGLVALGVGYCLFVILMLPNRVEGANGLNALPSNLVRSTTFWLPEDLRWCAVEGLRGQLGVAAGLGGGLFVVLLWCTAGWFLLRGSARVKFLLVAIVLDLAPPVIATGFSMRYGYLTYGWIAMGLALWLSTGRRLAIVAVILMGLSWSFDTVGDVLEQREAGRIVDNILADCRKARRDVGRGHTIAIVDTPALWGREKDITVLNLGLLIALDRSGVEGPFVAWRTKRARTSSDQELVDSEFIEESLQRRSVHIYRFDPRTLHLEPARR